MRNGFTLLETVIYLALFSIFLGSAIPAMSFMQVMSDRSSLLTLRTFDAMFVQQRISYELSQASTISTSPETEASSIYFVTKDGIPSSLMLSSGNIELMRGIHDPYLLNSGSVTYKKLSFDVSKFASSGEISVLISVESGPTYNFVIYNPYEK